MSPMAIGFLFGLGIGGVIFFVVGYLYGVTRK